MLIKNKTHTKTDVQTAHDHLLELAKLTTRLSEVRRAPRYPSGKRENDVEHTFHLALSASELAADYYTDLDVGLVTQFSLVHDLPESYTGDVWTLGISDGDRAKKEQAERDATERLLGELPPHTADILRRYEAQTEPEARFVRFVDKLLPDMIHILAGEASTYKQDHQIPDVDTYNDVTGKMRDRLRGMFPEFQFIHEVHDMILKTLSRNLF